MRIDHNKTSNPLWLYLVSIGISISYWTISKSYSGPAYLADEIGYLTNAAFLTGHKIDGASSYHAGYSLFLTPLFALFSNPIHVWQGVMVVNALLFGFSFYLLGYLINKLLPEVTEQERILALITSAVYPAWVTMSGYAFASPGIVFVYMLSVLTLLRWQCNSLWSIIPHSLCVGFLYWVHPTGLVIALASILVVTLSILKTKDFRPLVLHIILTGLLAVLYKKGIHHWLTISMTPEGYQPRLHYPSFSSFFKHFLDIHFLYKHFIPKLMGHLSYLAIGSFGIVTSFIVTVVVIAFQYLSSFKNSREMNLTIQVTIYTFLTLSVIGLVIVSSANRGGGIHYWIYGRYVEGALLPVLALGFIKTWRFKWNFLAILFVIASGIVLDIITTSKTWCNLVNIPAFWPLSLLPDGHFLPWMCVGAVGIMAISIINKIENNRRIAAFIMSIAWIACGVTQYKWHHKILNGYSAPSAFVKIIRLNFPKGSCIGFDSQMFKSLSLYQRERYNLYLFYFFNYRYRRMSPKEWLAQCNGPMLTYNPSVFLGVSEAKIIAREVKSGLYLVVRTNGTPLLIPKEIRDRSDVYFRSASNDSCLLAGCFMQKAQDLWKWEYSKVGELNKGFLCTNGKKGYLFFGPYVPLNKGNYKLILSGDFFDTSGAVLDIVSHKGKKVHAKFLLDSFRPVPGTPLIFYFSIQEDVHDIEVRLYVSKRTKIRFQKYQILAKDALLKNFNKMKVGREYLKFLPRQVGKIVDQGLKSDGRPGFLVFGPYIPMKAGTYHLIVKGYAFISNSAWVDVVSRKGKLVYAKFPLMPSKDVSGIIADGLVTIDKPVDDLEVRVYVGKQDRVLLEGYELIPIKKSTPFE